MSIHQLHVALNAVDFWAFFSCAGLLLVRVVLLPSSAFALPEIGARWRLLLGMALALLSITGLLLPLARLMEMSGDAVADAAALLGTVLRQTHFGQIWSLHLAGLLLLWLTWFGTHRKPGRAPAAAMLTIVAVLAWTYSASSHAADRGDFSAMEIGDWLHVVAASLWGGCILACGLLLSGLQKAAAERQPIAMLAGRLSTLSAAALALVLLTGTYNLGTRIDSADQLLHSAYGRLLMVKLLLVAAMAAVGALNRLLLVPRLIRWASREKGADERALHRFTSAMRVDMLLVLLVLCAAAVLIQSMPPSAAGMGAEMVRHFRS